MTPSESGPADRTAARTLTPGLLVVLGGLAAVGALSTNIILPSFPSIGDALGVATADLGITLSVFFLVFAVGQLFVGPLSDRLGRQPVILGGLAVFVAGSVVSMTATGLDTLVLGRAIQAAGACAASVLARAIARDLFQGDALARALSLTMVALAAAPGFSPLLGGLLDRFFGWQSTFVLVAVLGGALGIHYVRTVGETHPADARQPIDLGAILRAYVALLRDRRFVLPALPVALVIGGLYAMFAAVPAILMDGLGLSPLQVGLYFAATVFLVFGAGLLAPRLAARFGAATVAFTGLLIALGGGGLLLSSGHLFAPSFLLFQAATSVFLVGMGLANPLGTAIALSPFGRQAGLASALLGFMQLSAAGIGTALATSISGDTSAALGAVQVAFGVGSVLVFALVLRPKEAIEAA